MNVRTMMNLVSVPGMKWRYRVPWVRSVALFGVILSMLITTVSPVYAAGTTLQLSPASATVAPNSDFTVEVRINTGTESINAVQANFSYPANMVEFVRVSGTNSAFEIGAPSSGGNGRVSIARAQLGGVSSNDALVATVTFRVIAGSGSAAMVFTDGTEALSNTDSRNVLTGTSGGTYIIGSGASTGTGGGVPGGNLPTAKPDPAGNPSPPPVSSSSEGQSPGSGSGAPATDTSERTTELKNDAGGAAITKVFGQPVKSDTAVWGISGLALVTALAVGATIYLRRRHAAAAFVRPARPGFGYAQPVVVATPAAYYGAAGMGVNQTTPGGYGAAAAPSSSSSQADPTGRPDPYVSNSMYAPPVPAQAAYSQRQPSQPLPQGQPYQNPVQNSYQNPINQYRSGQYHGGQIQPVIVRPTPPEPMSPGTVTGQPQQSSSPTGWNNDP